MRVHGRKCAAIEHSRNATPPEAPVRQLSTRRRTCRGDAWSQSPACHVPHVGRRSVGMATPTDIAASCRGPQKRQLLMLTSGKHDVQTREYSRRRKENIAFHRIVCPVIVAALAHENMDKLSGAVLGRFLGPVSWHTPPSFGAPSSSSVPLESPESSNCSDSDNCPAGSSLRRGRRKKREKVVKEKEETRERRWEMVGDGGGG